MTSKAGYWIGGCLVALAVIAASAWVLIGLGRVANTVEHFQRVAIPGRGDVRLQARKYVIYIEGPRADEAVPVVNLAIARRGGSTHPPNLRPYWKHADLVRIHVLHRRWRDAQTLSFLELKLPERQPQNGHRAHQRGRCNHEPHPEHIDDSG